MVGICSPVASAGCMCCRVLIKICCVFTEPAQSAGLVLPKLNGRSIFKSLLLSIRRIHRGTAAVLPIAGCFSGEVFVMPSSLV